MNKVLLFHKSAASLLGNARGGCALGTVNLRPSSQSSLLKIASVVSTGSGIGNNMSYAAVVSSLGRDSLARKLSGRAVGVAAGFDRHNSTTVRAKGDVNCLGVDEAIVTRAILVP